MVITALICGTIMVIYCKAGFKKPIQKRNQERDRMEMMETRIAIPKSRMEDFITLTKMGFDKKNIAENINKTRTLGQVVEKLMAIDGTFEKETNNGNAIINANQIDVISAETEMIDLGTV